MRTKGPSAERGHEHDGPHAHDVLPGIVQAVETLRSALAEQARTIRSDRGVLLSGARAAALHNGTLGDGVTPAAQSGKLSSSPGRWLGHSARETSGTAAAVVRVHDGYDNSGDVLALIDLSANGSETIWLGPGGVAFGAGVYVEVVSGAVEFVGYLGGAR